MQSQSLTLMILCHRRTTAIVRGLDAVARLHFQMALGTRSSVSMPTLMRLLMARHGEKSYGGHTEGFHGEQTTPSSTSRSLHLPSGTAPGMQAASDSKCMADHECYGVYLPSATSSPARDARRPTPPLLAAEGFVPENRPRPFDASPHNGARERERLLPRRSDAEQIEPRSP